MTVTRPESIELVPQRGLRIRGAAETSWAVAGLGIPIKLRSWQILVAPRIITRGGSQVLWFEPVLEKIDLRHIPRFVHGKITERVHKEVAQFGNKLAWAFARALSRRWALSTKIVPSRAFALIVADSSVEVTAEQVQLTVRLDGRFEPLASAEKRPAAEATRAPAEATRQPAEKARPPVDKTRQPAEKTTRQPAEKTRPPVEKTTRQPAEKTTRQPAEKTTRPPAEKTTRQPAEKLRPPVEKLRQSAEKLQAAARARAAQATRAAQAAAAAQAARAARLRGGPAPGGPTPGRTAARPRPQ